MPKFNAYNDPGHAWIKVPRALINSLGIATKISTYSYQRKNDVYLECDCDYEIFFHAIGAQNKQVTLVHFHTNKYSKIRSYESYRYKEVL
jgi:hypothetical protein